MLHFDDTEVFGFSPLYNTFVKFENTEKNYTGLLSQGYLQIIFLYFDDQNMDIYGLPAAELVYVPNYWTNEYFKTVALNYFILMIVHTQCTTFDYCHRQFCCFSQHY